MDRSSDVRRFLFIFSMALLLVLFPSCSEKDLSQNPQDDSAEILIVSGNFQAAQPGESLNDPVVNQIVDSDQNPLQGVEVLFEIIIGSGSLNQSVTQTDTDGPTEVLWTPDGETEHILKISMADQQITAEAVYIYANTELDLQIRWVSGIPFNIEHESIDHDDRILESNYLLTFNDASGEEVKIIYSKMAEESLHKYFNGIESTFHLFHRCIGFADVNRTG